MGGAASKAVRKLPQAPSSAARSIKPTKTVPAPSASVPVPSASVPLRDAGEDYLSLVDVLRLESVLPLPSSTLTGESAMATR